MCDIDYCRSYSIYVTTLYVDCGPVYCMPPACLPSVCLQSCDKQNDSESSDCARGLNSTGRCESSARAHFASYCQNVVGTRTVQFCRTCALTLCGTYSASLPRNGNVVVQRRTSSLSVSCRREPCCLSFDIFSSRVSSSRTLVFNADHQLDDHREFREASTEAAGSYRLI